MTTLLDFILDLFRSPDVAASFIQDPDGALRDAGLPNVSPAQLQAVAATAAPAGLALGGGGDPVVGLQRAVANHHSIASPFSPQTTFAPQTQTEFASRNNTDVASNNDFMSPDQAAGANAQNGAFNLGFGDITLGDKTTNTATDGGVVNTGTAGDIDATNVKGDGNVVGNEDTNANTGVINDSNVNQGDDNEIDDSGDTTAGGDVIQDNEGPVINDVDMSGGNASGGDGGGGLIGVGNDGGNATGGSGGGIVINDNDSVGGNQTDVGGDVSGSGGIDNSVDNSVDNSGQDNSVDNSVDNSQTDNSVDNSQTVETNVDVTNDVGIF